MSEAIKEAEKILKQYYGYDHFREGQIPVIKAVLGGGDVLGIMPTGAGKSVCYQVPALMMEGITIVISPLISTSLRQSMLPRTVPRSTMPVSETTLPSITSPSVKTFNSRPEEPSSRREEEGADTGV